MIFSNNSFVSLRYILSRIVRNPLLMSLLVGVIVISLIPPLVSKHKASISFDSIPLNRLLAYYPSAEGNDSLSLVSFLRQSETAMFIEQDRTDYRLPGYNFEQYMYRYCPLSTPIRPSVYLGHLKGKESTEVVHVSQDEEGAFVFLSDATTLCNESKVSLPVEGEIVLSTLQYFESTQVGVLYIFVFSRVDKHDLHSTVFRYDCNSNSVKKLYSVHGLAKPFVYNNYSDYILLGKCTKEEDFIHIYNVEEERLERIVRNCEDNAFFAKYIKNLQTYPFMYMSEFFFVSKGRNNVGILDVDSLYLKGEKVFIPMPFSDDKGERLMVKYSRGDIAFYGTAISDKHYDLYKFDNKTKRLLYKTTLKNACIGQVLYYGDMDGNGKNELVFSDITKTKDAICVWEEGSSHDIVRCPISRQRFPIDNCLFYNNEELRFQCKGLTGTLKYRHNTEYYKNWLWKLCIFMGFYLVGFLLQKIKENKEYRHHSEENKVLSLQLENIQKRIDPHFIFNSLNNLGSLILDGNNNASYDYLSKVSEVLYKALHDRNLLIDIERELSFCASLLDIQQDRFKDKFEYGVSVDREVDLSQKIPPNVLNCFVDNCIKHGFNGIDYIGEITIEFLNKPEGVLLVVQDNGIGRELAKARIDKHKSTGTGLDICYKYVKLFNHNRKENFLHFSMLDVLNDDGTVGGTRCEFYIPKDLKFIYEQG